MFYIASLGSISVPACLVPGATLALLSRTVNPCGNKSFPLVEAPFVLYFDNCSSVSIIDAITS